MSERDTEDTGTFLVVVNHEEQYSIWFPERAIPLGWREAGKRGTKEECLSYIKEVWTDMRPLSLRRQMAESAQQEA
ncbi:MAG TPA: MbtH family protein [Ktedonobacteraceae bacterium]|nr:MbtH family protein [Ktedonobacteraceae bacterium]